eukprot:1826451-Amphidinium_carterae.1
MMHSIRIQGLEVAAMCARFCQCCSFNGTSFCIGRMSLERERHIEQSMSSALSFACEIIPRRCQNHENARIVFHPGIAQ